MPALSIDRPANVATPAMAATVCVPDKVPEPGFVPIASVTEFVAVVTVLPAASWTRTVMDGLIEAPEAVLVGCTPKASLVAVPAVTATVWKPVIEPVPVAVTVWLPAVLRVTVNVPTPATSALADSRTAAPSVLVRVTIPT